MTENTKIPAAQNPSKADTSFSFQEYAPYWKAFNEMLYILNFLPQSAWDGIYQTPLNDIMNYCVPDTNGILANFPGWGQLSASDAAKLIAPLAEQIKASPSQGLPEFGYAIADSCKKIESLSGS